MLSGSIAAASLCLYCATPAMAAEASSEVGCGDVTGLIAAIGLANANPQGGTIKLAERCAYRFEDEFQDDTDLALPPITGRVSIIGDESTLIRSSQAGVEQFRLLAVNEGGELRLKDVTVTGGDVDGDGGGIANEGKLWLDDCIVAGNQATGDGGGISNEGGTVTLVESRVVTNVVTTSVPGAAGDGGGISNNAAGTLILKKTKVTGNTADEDGGGIHNQGALFIEKSDIENNEARDDDGGGLKNLGTATIKNSEFEANWAGVEGAGIDNSEDATLNISYTSFEENVAGRDGGGINNEGTATLQKVEIKENQAGRDGAGINNEQDPQADQTLLTVIDSKITKNRAARAGGGINNWLGAKVTLKDTKVAENKPTNCSGLVPGCSG
ncbi:hypothetical protein [Nonomuraea sp. NPDC005501]|uniref:hypothetical protein n=1 Tax=Nonomuraea sp. NPDC005501 TaxID=3156884 RepID=UPI0033B0C05A